MASPEDQLATMLANLPEKTGKSLDASVTGWLRQAYEEA